MGSKVPGTTRQRLAIVGWGRLGRAPALRRCRTTPTAGTPRRYVYVNLARGADTERVPLFAEEPTEVLPVPDVATLGCGAVSLAEPDSPPDPSLHARKHSNGAEPRRRGAPP